MTKLKLTGKSNILKKTTSGINPKEFSLATKEAEQCPDDSCGGGGGSSVGYKKYVALLNPGENPLTDAPVATVLENTLGSNIIWFPQAPSGAYSGGNINFADPSKVFILMTGNYSGEGAGNVPYVGAEIYDDGSGFKLWFFPVNYVGDPIAYWGTPNAPLFIEVRVYP
jgi:hypothetical protein